jgi:hypothetical protein
LINCHKYTKTFGSCNDFSTADLFYGGNDHFGQHLFFTYRAKKDSSPLAQNDTFGVVILNPSTIMLIVTEGFLTFRHGQDESQCRRYGRRRRLRPGNSRSRKTDF